MSLNSVENLLIEIRGCQICQNLPLGPKPILQAGKAARIVIAGQAPGRIAHGKGQPFLDASGNRLRDWMGIGPEIFYDSSKVAIVPMGFCYPATCRREPNVQHIGGAGCLLNSRQSDSRL